MRWVLLMAVVYAAAVIDTSLADALQIGGVAPDLLALAAVVWLLTARGRYVFLAAGLLGLCGDLLAPGRVGIASAWWLMVGYGVLRLRTRFPLDGLWCQVPVAALAVAAWAAGVGLTRCLLGEVSLSAATILERALCSGLYTAAAGLPVLLVVGWVREPLLARQRELAEF